MSYASAGRTGEAVWGVFICHCSMCPTEDCVLHGGAPWAAVPRPSYQGPVDRSANSRFAERGRCGECGAAVYIRYHCEPHTDWVALPTLHADVLPEPLGAEGMPRVWHIHWAPTAPDYETVDERSWPRSPDGDEFWECDPCRPLGAPAPAVCRRCYLPACSCESSSDG